MTVTATDIQQTLFDQLCRYIDVLGAPVLALHGMVSTGICACPKGVACGANGGKHPDPKLCPRGVNSATKNKATILEWIQSGRVLNWGLMTGEPLPGGGYLVVLDVDPRNKGDDSLEDACKLYGALPETPMQITGGDGAHYFFRAIGETQSTVLGDGLDRKGKGGYVVVEPSQHHSGKRYHFESSQDLDVPVAAAPEWIALGKKAAPRPPWTGASAKESIIGAAFEAAGWLGIELTEGRWAVYCPWAKLHTDGRGKGGDASTVILPPSAEMNTGGFCCKHSHCANRTYRDAMASLPAEARTAAQRKMKLAPEPTVAVSEKGHTELTAKVTGGLTPEEMFEIREHLTFGQRKDGTFYIKKELLNLSELLKYDPRWRGVLSFDSFSHQILVNREPSWHEHEKRSGYEAKYPRQWADDDDARLKIWFTRYWGMEWERSVINEAVTVASQANGVHPVRSYLRSIEWDGVDRLDTWLSAYCNVVDNEYTRNVGKWWLISAVARVFRPGCKADHVLILEGPQGIGKSTVFAILGGEWVCDSTIVLGDKDAYQLIKGRWIIELAELDSLGRADASRAKAFFTSPSDTYRPSYGRATITVPRQCVFAGTVNHSQFLRDETGNRRYWPVLCGQINTLQLRLDRDQLWAEAVHRFNHDERWWPKGEKETEQCSDEQAQREASDEWEVVIARWLEGPDAKRELAEDGYITIGSVMKEALGIKTDKWGTNEMGRVARCMQRLEHKKTRVMKDGVAVWAFKKS